MVNSARQKTIRHQPQPVQHAKDTDEAALEQETNFTQTPVAPLVKLGQPNSLSRIALTPANILHLQRTVGNQAVQRMLAARSQQTDHSRPRQASPVIQRYTTVSFEDKQWKHSDSREILVREEKSKGRSKELYASEKALAKSNRTLESVASHIKLKAVGEYPRFGLLRLEPEFVGPGHEQGKVYNYDEVPAYANKKDQPVQHKPVSLSGPELTMPSDCNKSARVIMGIVGNEPVKDVLPKDLEVPVANMGPQEQIHARRELLNAKDDGKGASAVESGGLSSLTQSLLNYRAVANTRLSNTDSLYFLAKTQPLTNLNQLDQPTEDRSTNIQNKAQAKDLVLDTWKIFYDFEQNKPGIYKDFTEWAGLDAGIKPKIGDALVTYRPEVKSASNITTNLKAYNALVEVLNTGLADKQGAAELLGTVNKLAQDTISQANGKIIGQQKILENLSKQLNPNPESVQAAETTIAKATEGIILANETLKMVIGLVEVLQTSKDDPQARQNLAKNALGLLGIKQDTTYKVLNTITDNGISAFTEEINQKLETTAASNTLWNKHWGGVIMTDGDDYVTLENDASTDSEEKMGKLNEGWGFAMYGSKKKGQSFHAHMKASGDFGNFASTVRYRRPNQVLKDVPLPKQKEPTGEEAQFHRELNASITETRGHKGQLRAILDKLTWQQRRDLRLSYKEDLDLMAYYEGQPPHNILRDVVDLLTQYPAK